MIVTSDTWKIVIYSKYKLIKKLFIWGSENTLDTIIQ